MYRLFFNSLLIAVLCCTLEVSASSFSVIDLHPVEEDYSWANTINEQGLVVVGGIKGDMRTDYLWDEHNEFRSLYGYYNASMHSPQLNNQGDVAGVFWYRHWFSDKRTHHVHLLQSGRPLLDLGHPEGWDVQTLDGWPLSPFARERHELAVMAINDSGYLLLRNFCCPFISTKEKYALWFDGEFKSISPLHQAFFINNKNQILGKKGIYFAILNLEDESVEVLLRDKGIFVHGFNDRAEWIGAYRDYSLEKPEPQGLFWSAESGLVELNFQPKAINGVGCVLGWRKDSTDKTEWLTWSMEGGENKIEIELDRDDTIELQCMNSRGEIVGLIVRDKILHAILLKPEVE